MRQTVTGLSRNKVCIYNYTFRRLKTGKSHRNTKQTKDDSVPSIICIQVNTSIFHAWGSNSSLLTDIEPQHLILINPFRKAALDKNTQRRPHGPSASPAAPSTPDHLSSGSKGWPLFQGNKLGGHVDIWLVSLLRANLGFTNERQRDPWLDLSQRKPSASPSSSWSPCMLQSFGVFPVLNTP